MSSIDPDEKTSVSHPEISDWPIDFMWEEDTEWREYNITFRGQSTAEKLFVVLGGILVYFATFLVIVKGSSALGYPLYDAPQTGLWMLAIGGVPLLACEFYFIYMTLQARGWLLHNIVLLPIGCYAIVTLVFPSFLPPNDAALLSFPHEQHPETAGILLFFMSWPTILVMILFSALGHRWVKRNPHRALEWERRHLPVALFSHILSQTDGIALDEIAEGIGPSYEEYTVSTGKAEKSQTDVHQSSPPRSTNEEFESLFSLPRVMEHRFTWLTTERGLMKFALSVTLAGLLVLGITVGSTVAGFFAAFIFVSAGLLAIAMWRVMKRLGEERLPSLQTLPASGNGFIFGMFAGVILAGLLEPGMTWLGLALGGIIGNELEFRGVWVSPRNFSRRS